MNISAVIVITFTSLFSGEQVGQIRQEYAPKPNIQTYQECLQYYGNAYRLALENLQAKMAIQGVTATARITCTNEDNNTRTILAKF